MPGLKYCEHWKCNINGESSTGEVTVLFNTTPVPLSVTLAVKVNTLGRTLTSDKPIS